MTFQNHSKRLQIDLNRTPATDCLMSMKSKFKYVGIRVTDLKRSIDFYTKYTRNEGFRAKQN
jgi:hypothetical protein